ncbi:DUF4192 family protein [Bailinhaonella thermotolerans]|uniref:DUF4192 family protein n=1 Tax=Bailinhaonella thermotolerans TaxID=1070861 RepID=UPI0011C439BA|nr:DUF4192 family protein [Bailinhaonella thermotolerans]
MAELYANWLAPLDGSAREDMLRAMRRVDVALGERVARADPSDPAGFRASLVAEGVRRVREAVALHGEGGRLADDDVAWLAILCQLLGDVRDVAWALAVEMPEPSAALWLDVLRRAGGDGVRVPACLFAVAAALRGERAQALLALEHALRAHPGDEEAVRLDRLLREDVPPGELRRLLSEARARG